MSDEAAAFNARLAGVLHEMAALLELTGADRFRVNAHARAARAVADHPADLESIADDHDALTSIEGVGARTAQKITEFAGSGEIAEHAELRARVPAGLLGVLGVPGLGPKTVRAMWTELGVESLDDLKRAVEDGSLLTLPRTGKKTVENIRASLRFMESAGGRVPLGRAMPIAEALRASLASMPGVTRCACAGSLRRGRETVGDLDIIVSAADPAPVRDAFLNDEHVHEVLAAGETKCSVRLNRAGVEIQADLRLVPESSFGAALLYFTGSKEHNVRLRERAIKRSMTLNEYGLFPDDRSSDEPPQRRGVSPVAAADERDVYAALELPWIPAQLREDRGELLRSAPEDLIDVGHIRAELHAHTTASDGRLSIAELAHAARERGFHTIAVTDHSASSVIANGLDEDRLRRHAEEVRRANEEIDGITILAGSEVDIHPDGTLDYDDDLLGELDVVVASPHASLRQSPGDAQRRLLRAVAHPFVHVLGHPTGRIIGGREGLAPDIAELAAAAAEHATALEINANWRRLDLRDTHVRTAIEHDAVLAINCDVHKPEHFDNLLYGVLTARRAGLSARRCVNTWDADELLAWLGGETAPA